MKHARVAIYTFKPGTVDEVLRQAEAGMLPIFRSQPGFVSYGAIKTGEDSGISLSIWDTREQAEAAVQTAASWVRENLGQSVVSVQNHVGDVTFYATAQTLIT